MQWILGYNALRPDEAWDLSTPCNGFFLHDALAGSGRDLGLSTPCNGFIPTVTIVGETEAYLSTPCNGFPTLL